MLALFAQAAGNGNNDFDDLDPEELAIILAVCGGLFLLAFLIWLVVSIFFMRTLSRTLNLCRPKNRMMEPGQVWLNLIPGFNAVWLFITVNRVADSLQREFRSRGWRNRENFGRTLGIVLGVFSALNFGCYIGALIPIILLVIYWGKIAEYNRQLAARYEEDDDDEYEDDRGDDEDGRREDEGGERDARPGERR